jgi:hypothetical protein
MRALRPNSPTPLLFVLLCSFAQQASAQIELDRLWSYDTGG